MSTKFDVEQLQNRFVIVDGVEGKDKRLRTRKGFIKRITFHDPPRTPTLHIEIWEGTAQNNTKIDVDFSETRWRLMYPEKKP
jgi:hypothetical protein